MVKYSDFIFHSDVNYSSIKKKGVTTVSNAVNPVLTTGVNPNALFGVWITVMISGIANVQPASGYITPSGDLILNGFANGDIYWRVYGY